MIRFECPHCGQPVEVDDEFAGRRGRCPGCRGVVAIPPAAASPASGAAQSAGEAVRSEPTGSEAARDVVTPAEPPPAARPRSAAFSGEAGGRGPRKLTLPDSISAVQVNVPDEQAPGTGRKLARVSLVLACLPLASVIGLALARAAAAQARQGDDPRGRRTAGRATRVAIVMNLVSAALVVMAMIAVAQEQHAGDVAEECRQAMESAHGSLESYAIDHADRYPSSLDEMDMSSGLRFGYVGDNICPETERQFGYVTGLKSEPTSPKIVLYDVEPSHGCRTALWRRPAGRNVCRVNGRTEFLSEEEFQREMAGQGATPAGP